MRCISLLWLALLGAFSHSCSPTTALSERALAIAAASDSNPGWATASALSSQHALRSPARTAAVLVSQSSGVVIPDRSDSPPLERAAFRSRAAAANAGQRVVRATHHRVASRGSVLPYFPTAPPPRL